jgi:2-(1,2-epoxy-1,2-dihydrophenyl)acetyl-CoA isomerase
MELQNVAFERTGSLATLKFNRPKTFNAFSLSMGQDLIEALEACYYDDGIRAVILTGEGKAFCSGGDISVFKTSLEKDPSRPIRELIVPFNKCITLIRRMPKPVICAVNGVASGAGMSFVAACDYRVAASSAKFKQAYTGVGLSGDGAWMLLVPMLIGFARATEMVFFDPLIDAEKALAWGLINRIVEDDKLMEASMAVAAQLASGATKAFGLAKNNLNHAMMGLLESQLQFEAEGMIKASMTTKDYLEGIRAFLEKRKPEFIGR